MQTELFGQELEEKMEGLLNSAKTHVFKLELLDSYSDAFDDERHELNYYISNGEEISGNRLYNSNGAWYNTIKKLTESGVKFIRIHVVTQPLTQYLRFEIESYKISQKMGEEIFFLDRKVYESMKKRTKLDMKDLMIFDYDNILFNNFEVGDGNCAKRFDGCTLIADNKVVKEYSQFYRLLLNRAVPMNEFLGI
ncbi:MAG: hypothetical protein KGH77_06135 [Candidatus Micrarchaeota archaeon]|nr:hypothetical protein [Candidatus Micrarchaeota archaeon]